jgi:hypothetical protein
MRNPWLGLAGNKLHHGLATLNPIGYETCASVAFNRRNCGRPEYARMLDWGPHVFQYEYRKSALHCFANAT